MRILNFNFVLPSKIDFFEKQQNETNFVKL